jgi:hypothetical protein
VVVFAMDCWWLGSHGAYSDGCRTPIPIRIGQSFQFKADTCSD